MAQCVVTRSTSLTDQWCECGERWPYGRAYNVVHWTFSRGTRAQCHLLPFYSPYFVGIDTKSCWSLLPSVNARGSKRPHAGKCWSLLPSVNARGSKRPHAGKCWSLLPSVNARGSKRPHAGKCTKYVVDSVRLTELVISKLTTSQFS